MAHMSFWGHHWPGTFAESSPTAASEAQVANPARIAFGTSAGALPVTFGQYGCHAYKVTGPAAYLLGGLVDGTTPLPQEQPVASHRLYITAAG